MASFQFINNYSGETTILNNIDEEMCKDLNVTCDQDRCCGLYDTVVNLGFAILMRFSGSHVTELTYLQWRAQLTGDEQFLKHETLLRKYLYGKYKFTAWR
jgi:hypothetical protein